MKSITTSLLALTLAIHISAFSIPRPTRHPRGHVTQQLKATITAEELENMSKEEQFSVLGVKEEELALGIDPDEVLEFLGTKQDLINKFQADLPKLSPTETETEVSKFLMDGEMLDLYIKYSRRKAEDPTWEPVYQEEDNSPVAVFFRIFSQYAVWIAGGILLKDIVTNFLNKGGADAAV